MITVLSISCKLLNPVLKLKKGMVVCVQNDCKRIGCLPSWLCGWPGAKACYRCPASQDTIRPHITTLGKDENSKYSFYWFSITFAHCEAKKKNHKSNHHIVGGPCNLEWSTCLPLLTLHPHCSRTLPLTPFLPLAISCADHAFQMVQNEKRQKAKEIIW